MELKEIVCIYGKRWDIEVFFKIQMVRHHLNLEKEAQLRDYDEIIGHTTIAKARYIFLAVEQRCHDYRKPLVAYFSPAAKRSKTSP